MKRGREVRTAKSNKGAAEGNKARLNRTPVTRAANPPVVAHSGSTPLKKGEAESVVFEPRAFELLFLVTVAAQAS